MKTGIIVARFQVPFLHHGHIHLIHSVVKKSDQVVIILGSPSQPDIRNILPFDIRREMIAHWWRNGGLFTDKTGKYTYLFFNEILDHHEDARWSMTLDKIVDRYENPTLYGSRDSFAKFYTGKHKYVNIKELKNVSGTQVRENMNAANNIDYRIGLIEGYTLHAEQHSSGNW